MHRITIRSAAVLLPLALAGCDAVNRVRGGGDRAEAPVSANAGPLTLGLHTPGVLVPGQEGLIRLSLTNRGDTVAHPVRVELQVPEWMEPLPPREGDPEVVMGPGDAGHTRFTYRLDDTLRAGQTRVLNQRFRVAPATRDGSTTWSRAVRARLLSGSGGVLAEIESEVAVQRGASPDSARPAAPPAAAAPGEPRDRLGPVHLGMAAAALRQAAPGAKDTTWSQEGSQERGVLVPLPGEGRALAVLGGDTVMRIEVRDPQTRTREGMGVGSRYSELRAAYGPACAGIGEGIVVVWFPAAPGASFALDAPVPANPGAARALAEGIPATSRVTRWWLRRGADRC